MQRQITTIIARVGTSRELIVMKNIKCACQEFEELRGAGVNNYISTFLETAGKEKNRYLCKICATIWVKEKTADATKPVLVKIRKV